MEDPILWTDWRKQRIASLKAYMEFLTFFVKTRFGDSEVEMQAEYKGPGAYRLKYWYGRQDGKPPLVKLDWEMPL